MGVQGAKRLLAGAWGQRHQREFEGRALRSEAKPSKAKRAKTKETTNANTESGTSRPQRAPAQSKRSELERKPKIKPKQKTAPNARKSSDFRAAKSKFKQAAGKEILPCGLFFCAPKII